MVVLYTIQKLMITFPSLGIFPEDLEKLSSASSFRIFEVQRIAASQDHDGADDDKDILERKELERQSGKERSEQISQRTSHAEEADYVRLVRIDLLEEIAFSGNFHERSSDAAHKENTGPEPEVFE